MMPHCSVVGCGPDAVAFGVTVTLRLDMAEVMFTASCTNTVALYRCGAWTVQVIDEVFPEQPAGSPA